MDLREVHFVLEDERRDPLRDEVAAVDAGERLRDDRADPKRLRGQGGVLAARTLPVVLAGNDEAAALLTRALRERRVEALEGEFGDRVHVRPQGHHDRAVGREVAGRNVVAERDDHLAVQGVLQWRLARRRLDVRSLHDLDPSRLVRGRGNEDVRVVDTGIHRRDRERRLRAQVARIGDDAAQRRRGRRGRAAQVDLIVVRAAPAGEVPIERADRDAAGGRRLAHADARAAGRLEHACAARDHRLVCAAVGEGVEDLLRPRGHGHEDLGVGGLALHHGGDDGEVRVAGVHARSHADLLDLDAGDLAHGHDVAGARRLRDERLELREVDDLALVV